MNYVYSREKLNAFERNHLPEWVATSGNGGFSSQSIFNSSFRKQHGYLIISKKPPINRTLILKRTDEIIKIENDIYDLASQKYSHKELKGDQYLESFSYDGIPTYVYQAGSVNLTKTLSPDYGHNTVGIHYSIKVGSKGGTLEIYPLVNDRGHGDVSTIEDLVFDRTIQGHEVMLVPRKDPKTNIFFNISDGIIEPLENDFLTDMFFDFDVSTGDDRTDCSARPFKITLKLKPNAIQELSVVVSTEGMPTKNAKTILSDYRLRQTKLIKTADHRDEFAQKLVIAADQFIAYRQSTEGSTILAGMPWFTDWGRDTMIAYSGLCLSTKRYHEAKSILRSFLKYEKNGLIPNMFPDDGQDPYYNTVDASLWYFQAAKQYTERTRDSVLIREELYPVLKKIIDAYRDGTDFSIGMDKDGLIHAGSGLDQVTWMDVRINGVVVTPRHGKPVEINALWYNALMIMDDFSNRFGMDGSSYRKLANKVKKAFNKRFWNPKTHCLFDVVDDNDASIRPNQLFAVSLAYPVISGPKAKSIVSVATKELLDVYGLRTLSKNDPRFKPIYSGNIESRDFAYHMGTVWPFLLGSYMDAYLRINHNSNAARAFVRSLCLKFNQHLEEGCINGISEIFDGLNGTISRGCYTQAWSVAEILRIWTENQLYHDEDR